MGTVYRPFSTWRRPLKPLAPHAAAAWRRSYDRLVAFVRREGHTQVPWRHHEGGCALGGWVRRQRAKWREDRLLEEHRQLLEAVPGWDWGEEGMAQMPVEPEPRHGGHEWNYTQYDDGLRATLLCTLLHGRGPMPRAWVRTHAAEGLLHGEYDPARHLREGGRMMWLVDRAIRTALRTKCMVVVGDDHLRVIDLWPPTRRRPPRA